MIGLDLAKNIFQVHGVDVSGNVVVRKALRRSQVLPFFERTPRCLVGIEACGTSHHWARELFALGHEVRLIPPAYVKPYVTRGKTDAADADAICEAVTRPTMRFVSVKSRDQQAALSMHRARNLLVKQWTQLVNMMRGRLAEFGINIPQGLERALMMARQIVDGAAPDVAPEAVKIIGTLSQQALDVHVRWREIDCDLLVWQRSSEVARRRMTIPGIGPVGATVFAATVVDASPVPLRPAVRRLAGVDPAAEVERWQGAAWSDHQDWRQVSATNPRRSIRSLQTAQRQLSHPQKQRSVRTLTRRPACGEAQRPY